MATELQESPKSKLADSFRQAADPKNTSGRNPPAKPAETAVLPPVEKPVETVKPAGETAPKVVTPPAESDADAGLKKLITPTDKETNMANLRKKAEEAERRATELEARLRETEGRIPQDYDQVKKDREDLMTALERTNIEESPRFKEKYDKPQQQLLSSIKKTLAVTDADADTITALVQQPESRERTKALADAIEGLDRVSQGKLVAQVNDFDQLRDARVAELSNPRETFQQMKAEQENQTRAQREKSNQVIESTIKEFQKLPILQPIEGNEAWNARVNSVLQNARNYWTAGRSQEELAAVTVAGALAPMYKDAFDLSMKENERLNAELAEYREASPKTNAGGSTADKGGAEGAKPAGALAAFNKGAYGQENRPARA